MKKPQLYVIPAGVPFVDDLAAYLLTRYEKKHENLSRVRILLPSRRSIRSLRDAFLRATEGKPLLLPRMHPIGEVDTDDLLFAGEADASVLSEILSMPDSISSMQRLMILTRLVWQKNKQVRLEQSVHIAMELAKLLDEVEREELALDNVKSLVPDEYSMHWQETLEFLHIISDVWPQYTEQVGKMGAIARRSRVINLLVEQWQNNPSPYPVIAAGTTGSIPATARLLKVIAQMPEGMVVLPGFDRNMPEQEWHQVGENHPQYGFKQLLNRIEVSREHVMEFPSVNSPDKSINIHNKLLHYALQPAESTSQWSNVDIASNNIRDIRMVECESVYDEARAISLMIREALDDSEKTVALVTPDRELARRVIAITRRYGVLIDDSAGIPLSNTPSAVFLRLIAEMAVNRASPISLLSVLKHPLAAMGRSPLWALETARKLELTALRGVRFTEGLAGLRKYVGDRNTGDDEDCLLLLDRLAEICDPFLKYFYRQDEGKASSATLSELLDLHIECAEKLAATAEESGVDRLWRGDKGELLAAIILEIKQAVKDFLAIDPVSYSGVIDTLLAGVVWRPKYGVHPRIHILSPMEARLQYYDMFILAGLNEGVWPAAVPTDPWMSRPMRSGFGLPMPERTIGQSAHDFYMLAANSEVILTRSRKAAGTATIPSRWWSRINVMLEKTGNIDAVREKKWNGWAAQLDRPDGTIKMSPPAPCPPVGSRPRRLSVTSIEKLLRDPYSIYARYILGLRRIDPIDKDPGMADFGNMVHEALEQFVRKYPKNLPDNAEEELLICGREVFSFMSSRPSVVVFWWPRFERIARWFVAQEASRRMTMEKVYAEVRGEYTFSAPAGTFTLSAKADRIEKNTMGNATIVDYKTGSLPRVKDVRSGLSPQLLLEALILQEGGFSELDTYENGVAAENLEYWKLSGGKDTGVITSISVDNDVIEKVKLGLESIIITFDSPQHPYLACPIAHIAPRYNDYTHLARVDEWRA